VGGSCFFVAGAGFVRRSSAQTFFEKKSFNKQGIFKDTFFTNTSFKN